ncbi:hypothetical protein PGUG_00056 [Meyerozyma guilliermondii ATCC 6260]|uniref:Uncharacterized protein n=1 Tax=Meyerozyma guilliermondii (strain ATCC 6260 / CBS 566 / DSM 6381 / JCM 1539 / NBRC 10279 / NRRL Y-324) TaxID=294746 RepID=A5D9V1_PICGU|nr:uncharacterized protein PGUG_00056 [Meyerozyma guilliermondii ATCC 6260]EDK35958.2 hypothetical protein PGUG_00056 [Meyerozyma guilliermondii ATCC 6260]
MMTSSHLGESEDLHRRVGVTHYIRTKLNFFDDTLWKRFSARRLELIDALDLSCRKASEQESEIKRVAETLRLEFNYGPEYIQDFDRLVRAAIQSVRRNRKRSLKQTNNASSRKKKLKTASSVSLSEYHESPSPEQVLSTIATPSYSTDEDMSSLRFVSEIARLHSDSQDDMDGYNRSRRFTSHDKSRAVIDSIIQPKQTKLHPRTLPPLTARNSSFQGNSTYAALLGFIERSKTCADSTVAQGSNLENLGRSAIQCCVSYIFETSLSDTSSASVEYLNTRITSPSFLATLYRDLDPSQASCDDEVAVISLHTLIGGCIKDFGFGQVMMVLSDCLHSAVIQSYPLLTKKPGQTSGNITPVAAGSTTHLDSLATIATNLQDDRKRSSPSTDDDKKNKKAVTLRYMNTVLAFSYPATTSAVPRLIELLDNGRTAFHITHLGDTRVLGLRNMRDGKIINSDSTLEMIFKKDERIELELYIQDSKAVPISELTSTISPNVQNPIVLPPVGKIISQPPDNQAFPFLSKKEGTPPLQPNFQPLL